MEITKIKNDSLLTLAIAGRVDSSNASELEREITENLDGVTGLILDLGKLEYISSAGLRVLLVAQKRMNAQGSLKLINVKDYVMEILNVTGFADILTIE